MCSVTFALYYRLNTVLLALSLPQTKHQFEQLREEIRNKNLEEINMLRISLDAQIEDLEQLFETAHLNYLQQTAQRTHDFKELTHKDQILDVDINQKKKKIDNLQVRLFMAAACVCIIASAIRTTHPIPKSVIPRPQSSTGGQRCAC